VGGRGAPGDGDHLRADPKGSVFDGYRNRLWQSETLDGIRVIRVWSYMTRNEGCFKRILDYVSFMVTSFFAGMFVRRVDLVIGTSPQFFAGDAAWALGFAKRQPFVFELRDIWPESIRAVAATQESRVLNALERLELFLYRLPAAVVAVTNAFRDNRIGRGIDVTKISVTRNGADLARFSPMPRDAGLAAELGLTDKFVVGYVGTHGMAHALGTMLETAAMMRENEDIRFVLLGDGAEKPALQARAAELGLTNMQFLDSVPRAEVPRYWSLLDASLIHLRKTDLFRTVIPSKAVRMHGHGPAGAARGRRRKRRNRARDPSGRGLPVRRCPHAGNRDSPPEGRCGLPYPVSGKRPQGGQAVRPQAAGATNAGHARDDCVRGPVVTAAVSCPVLLRPMPDPRIPS
jgi:hypothetical protein